MEAIGVIAMFCLSFAGLFEPQVILWLCRLDGWCVPAGFECLLSSLCHWNENVHGRLFFFNLIHKRWFSWTVSPMIRCLCETWKYLPSMQHLVLVLKAYFLWVCRLIPCDVCMGYKLHGCMLVVSYEWSLELMQLLLFAWLDAVLIWDVYSGHDQSSEFTTLTILGLYVIWQIVVGTILFPV